MLFKDLFADFTAGTPIKRKIWAGYWQYKYGKVNMHCKDSKVVDIKDTEDIIFTLSGIIADDWEIATKDNSTYETKQR